MEGIKTSGEWCVDRTGTNTVPGQGREVLARSLWTSQAVVSEQVTSQTDVNTCSLLDLCYLYEHL